MWPVRRILGHCFLKKIAISNAKYYILVGLCSVVEDHHLTIGKNARETNLF